MPTLRGRAPAKINLGLRILGPRPDGYHELRTVFQTISLADRVEVAYSRRAAAGVRLSCSDPALQGENNLAARAARALLERGHWPGGVRIRLDKRIPTGGGLGGGSSDAAAVLLALRRLLNPPPPADVLQEIAAGLGSDVPFFLLGGRAVGAGRGEEVYPLPDLSRRWLLLVIPDQRVDTAEAYRALRKARRKSLTPQQQQRMINVFCSEINEADSRGDLPAALSNDFEEILFSPFPAFQDWKRRLVEMGASAAMLSGSGSALFGVFPDRAAAVSASRRFGSFPGRLSVVSTLSRRAYRAGWGS